MSRMTALSLAAGLGLSGLASCGQTGTMPGDAAFSGPRNTNSTIAGATVRCQQDYPDSRLVFGPDGTLSGRYAGHEVTGEWSALGPEQVEVLVRAGGMAVRETMRRTGSGWRGDNTACG